MKILRTWVTDIWYESEYFCKCRLQVQCLHRGPAQCWIREARLHTAAAWATTTAAARSPSPPTDDSNGINRFMEEVGFYSEVSTFIRTIQACLDMRSSRVFLALLACGYYAASHQLCKLFTVIIGGRGNQPYFEVEDITNNIWFCLSLSFANSSRASLVST